MAFNISDLKLNIENIGKLIFEKIETFKSSKLANDQFITTLKKFVEEYKPILRSKLIYRASVDGFHSSNFHQKCDNISNTVTIIRSNNGYVFGGFTTQTWEGSDTYKKDDNAFIFSLINAENNPQKFLIKTASNGSAIYCNSRYGPTFGGGHDIYICSDPNMSNNGSKFGTSYNYSGGNRQGYLTGSSSFVINEIEVFAITFLS